MVKEFKKRQWRMSNASAVTAGTNWFPFGESTGPSDLEQQNYFPLTSCVLENKSTQEVLMKWDYGSLTSPSNAKTVPDGNDFTIENEDEIRMNTIAIENTGALDIGANELVLTVRNY